MEGATKILHGDRSSGLGIGPDGSPEYLTSAISALRSAPLAMDQADFATKRLEGLRTQLRGNLSTAELQLEFDDISRRYTFLLVR